MALYRAKHEGRNRVIITPLFEGAPQLIASRARSQ
jgi:hypothetical protein